MHFCRINALHINMKYSLGLAVLAGSASSTILWDGRFNDLTSSTDLNNWSWSDEVGPYQYYIVFLLRQNLEFRSLIERIARL